MRSNQILVRLARPFARIEPEEALSVVVAAATVFFLLTAYYLIKTAREPLILLHGGAEVKSYAAAGQAVLLVLVVRVYSAVARRVGRMRLLAIVYLFFVANLLVFAVLARTSVPIGVAFYLWVGIFNYTAVAQFWGFAADIYSPDQGKRLFAILGIGSSLGAVAGAWVAGAMVPLGPQALMLTAAAILVLCVLLFAWLDRRSTAQTPKAAVADQQPLTHESAFSLVARDRYLLLVAALTLLLNWVNTNGEYLLDRTLLAAVASGQVQGDPATFVGRFKGDYFAWVNLVGMLLQLFAVSRILQRFGVRVALFFLPVVASLSYGLMLVAPVLSLIRIGKIAENSLDYSVQNTARQALYLVTSRVEKYVGKTAVDTIFVRLGDVLSAGVVWVGVRLSAPTSAFAILNLMLIAVWLAVLTSIGREHRRRSEEGEALVALEPVAS